MEDRLSDYTDSVAGGTDIDYGPIASRPAVGSVPDEAVYVATDETPLSEVTQAELAAVGATAARKVVPINFDLFGPRTPQADAFNGDVSITTYTSSTAYTATTIQLFNVITASLSLALVEVVWTPNAVGSGIQINKADAGPTNVVQIAECTGSSSATPIASVVDVTTALQTILADGAFATNGKFIGWKHKTDGTNNFDLYAIRLKCAFEA